MYKQFLAHRPYERGHLPDLAYILQNANLCLRLLTYLGIDDPPSLFVFCKVPQKVYYLDCKTKDYLNLPILTEVKFIQHKTCHLNHIKV